MDGVVCFPIAIYDGRETVSLYSRLLICPPRCVCRMGQLPLRDDKPMSLGGRDLKERRERERRRVPRPRMHANFHDRQSTVIKATASFDTCAPTIRLRTAKPAQASARPSF